MKTSSCKAKGRRLQQLVAKILLGIGADHGLVADDIVSRGMGQNGVDVILSPAAKVIFPLAIECKNVEKLNVTTTFVQHFTKYKEERQLKLLVHSRNRLDATTGPLVTIRLEDFARIVRVLVGREEWKSGLITS